VTNLSHFQNGGVYSSLFSLRHSTPSPSGLFSGDKNHSSWKQTPLDSYR